MSMEVFFHLLISSSISFCKNLKFLPFTCLVRVTWESDSMESTGTGFFDSTVLYFTYISVCFKREVSLCSWRMHIPPSRFSKHPSHLMTGLFPITLIPECLCPERSSHCGFQLEMNDLVSIRLFFKFDPHIIRFK